MYVRFVVATPQQNPWWATGVITSARILGDDGVLEPYEVDVVEAAFDWFNTHLPCPPFQQNLNSGRWTQDAVAWFLPYAREPIARMWDLVAVLKQHGVATRMLRSYFPGRIVYIDDFQIVAETPRQPPSR